ncbi:hypothetical protein HN51_067816 [Arachis hypogaea]
MAEEEECIYIEEGESSLVLEGELSPACRQPATRSSRGAAAALEFREPLLRFTGLQTPGTTPPVVSQHPPGVLKECRHVADREFHTSAIPIFSQYPANTPPLHP